LNLLQVLNCFADADLWRLSPPYTKRSKNRSVRRAPLPESAMSFFEDQRCPKGDDQQRPENIPSVAVNYTEVLQQKQDSERKYKESKKHHYSPSLAEGIKTNV
jgi:hypothetical protein